MAREQAGGLTKIGASFCLLTIFAVSTLTGCVGEEEKGIPQAAGGACEIYDKVQLPGTVEVNFGNRIKLLGITTKRVSQNKIELSYFWQVLDAPGPYKHVFVHFTDPADHKILFQDDHPFCPPFSIKRAKGRFLKETSIVPIPQPEIGKEVNIMVGIYAPELKSGPRLDVESLKGVPVKWSAAIFEKVRL